MSLIWQRQMGSDDEIAVVQYKNMYCVTCVHGHNWVLAIIEGSRYHTKEEAYLAAHRLDHILHTEYGVNLYENNSSADLHQQLIRFRELLSLEKSQSKEKY